MIVDLLLMLGAVLERFWLDSRNSFLAANAIGLLLGAGVWWFAIWITRNFNKQFSFTWQHHLLCGLCATAVWSCSLMFVACRYAQPAAELLVQHWTQSILHDGTFQQATFREAYEAVFALRDSSGKQVEDFSNYPHPDTGAGTRIPTTTLESLQMVAGVTAKNAAKHFADSIPFLSAILWANPGEAKQAITQTVVQTFASGMRTFKHDDAIKIASTSIQQRLKEQTPRIVLISRAGLIIVFLLMLGVIIFLLIRAALKDIKEHRASKHYIGE